MAVVKNFLKTRASCKVKFIVSPEDARDAGKIYLVGDFNEWNDTAHPMKKRRDGSFALELEFPLGKDCRFRYRTEDNRWLNEPEADAYEPCPFAGADNSVIKV